MAFVPLNQPSLDVRAPPPPHVVARRKAMPVLDAAPVVSELLRDDSGGFVLRALDLGPDDPRAPSEAQRWHQERKTVRKALEADFGIESVEEDTTGEVDEWVPSGSSLPAGTDGLAVVHSLARRAGLMVVVFVRTIDSPQARAQLASLSMGLLPRLRKRGGRILAVTSAPVSGGVEALRALLADGIEFPVVLDPAASLARHYRVYVDKAGIAHDGLVVLQAVDPPREVAIGSEAPPVSEADKEVHVLYHYHATPGPQTDEECDRGDPVSVHLEQRVPQPWQMVVRYGFPNDTFKQLPLKISLRERNERLRVAQADLAAKRKQSNKVVQRTDRHFDRHDPDFRDYWRREDDIEEEAQAKKYLVSAPRPETIWKLLVALIASAEKARHLEGHAAQLTKSAVKRLARDWKEVTLHPLPSISASPPYDNNILEWHADMIGPATAGPYANVRYHLILLFPRDYPMSPPTVRFRGALHHNHVFGSYICLDMLTDIATEAGVAAPLWQGWSSAYTVQSILLQLQAFLFDGARQPRVIPTDVETYPSKERDLAWNKTITSSIAATRSFSCPCAETAKGANQFVRDIQDKPVAKQQGGLDVVAAQREKQAIAEKQVAAAQMAEGQGEKKAAPVAAASSSPAPVVLRKSAPVKPLSAPGGLVPAGHDEWTMVSKPNKSNHAQTTRQAQKHARAPGGPPTAPVVREVAVRSRANSVSSVSLVASRSAPVPSGPRPLSLLTPTPVASVVPQFDPWDPQISADVLYRSAYFGRVMRLTVSGVLVDLGLPRRQWAHCHVSQLRDEFTEDAPAHFAVGDLVKARISRLEPELNRIACSFKGRFGKLVAPIPTAGNLYPAKITAFSPQGGFLVSFHDGERAHTGVVRNDSALTIAFNGVHFCGVRARSRRSVR